MHNHQFYLTIYGHIHKTTERALFSEEMAMLCNRIDTNVLFYLAFVNYYENVMDK